MNPKSGKHVLTKQITVSTMPRAHVIDRKVGLFKAVVDADTKEILGATLFGPDSHEIINLVKMAMDHHLPYTVLRDQVFTHPTMAENLNDLFDL